jgi:oligoendopeptidase F
MAHARAYAPSSLDAALFAALEPHYRELLGRAIGSADDLEQLILDRSDLDALVAEKAANLYIATTRNTEDKVAEAAFLAFVRDVDPKLKPLASELDRKIATSPFAPALPGHRYEVMLRGLRVDIELFREANIALETQLAELDQKYSQIIGRMTVDFDGETRTMPQMSRYLEENDQPLRERAWKAISARRLEDRDAIDEIYDQMLALRQQIAVNAGFGNFRDFQHRRLKRFDYAPADCIAMHAAIEECVVPIQRRLDRERSSELGTSLLRPWDLSVDVKGRKPLRPFEGAERLIDGCSRMFHAMDAELGQMFDSMRDGDCLDLESRPGKAPGGYQYQRQYSRRPFIFMNAAGMHRDLVTMVHEAGHAFHSLLSKEDPLLEYRGAPTEFSEVASMSMELLTLPYHAEFYSEEECQRALRERLEKFPTIMAWIATIDAFQHWVYTNPGHTRAERTEAWRGLVRRFGNDVSWEGCEDARDAQWQRQLHLFGMPFYYIEYGIAETGAIQMWLNSRRDPKGALANYRKGLALGGSRPLPELFGAAGLRLDLGAGLMRELAREVDGELTREMVAS